MPEQAVSCWWRRGPPVHSPRETVLAENPRAALGSVREWSNANPTAPVPRCPMFASHLGPSSNRSS
jgi:hypothetical protein